MSTLKLIAGHGYDPRDRRMQPIFIARGPAFRSNFDATAETKAMSTKDIFGVVAHLLGKKPFYWLVFFQ